MILLDTHALLWLDCADANLGHRARTIADRALGEAALFVSAISFWEVGMLAAKGRIEPLLPVAAWRQQLLAAGLDEIPVDGQIAATAAALEGFHGDPADRLIVATAWQRGTRLLTADRAILGWDGPVGRLDARD